MPTIKQLKVENKRLRQMQDKLKEMQKNNEDRRRLLSENKKLARGIKHEKVVRIGKSIGRDLKRGGKILSKAGIGTLKGLQRYAIFLNQQEARQRALNRKLKSAKRRRK